MRMNKEMLKEKFMSGEPVVIMPFYGHKPTAKVSDSCLSNWFECTFVVEGVEYHTNEQYMMAQKALLFGDQKIYEMIMAANDPKEYKALGRAVKNFRPGVWEKNKYEIVLKGLIAKFSQNEDLKEYLLSTGDKVLVEAAPRDLIWGIGLGKNNVKCYNPFEWRGRNLLGFALMEARDVISGKES